jgi:hypothetical protein
MSKVILWHDPITGGLCITIPAYTDRIRPSDETEDDFLAGVIARAVPAGVPTRLVDDSDPGLQDRTFRNAFEDTGVAVQVNMPKARVIHMDRIRQKRNEELQKLDIPFMMASERNDQEAVSKIATQKQKLRDIPQKYDLSGFKTPEKLKAAWPKELDEKIKDVKKAL